MPLDKSVTPLAFTKNLKTELAAGKPKKQALAISYSVKRKAGSKDPLSDALGMRKK